MPRWVLVLPLLVGCTSKDDTGPADDTDPDTDVTDTDTGGGCTPRDWFRDADGDGVGDESAGRACEAPSADAVDRGGDCDDGDPTVHPGATELCDDVDEDCDPTTLGEGLLQLDGVQYNSVQAAVDAASPGDTIVACGGVHNEVVVVEKPVTLMAVALTTIAADGLGRALDLGADVTVHGFMLTAGTGVDDEHPTGLGGGLRVRPGATATVDSVEITGNIAEHGGGVAVEAGGTLVATDLWIHDNDGGFGAGLWTEGDVTLTSTRVVANAAKVEGGGLWIGDATVTADAGTDVSGNVADVGGGVALRGDFAELVSSVVHDNASTTAGGVSAEATTSRLDGVSVVDNLASDSGGGLVLAGTVTSTGLVVVGNTAVEAGGGIEVAGASWEDDGAVVDQNAARIGGGVHLDVTGSVSWSSCVLTSNVAADEGGALYVGDVAGDGLGVRLDAVGCDWGTDPTDNSPDDVWTSMGATRGWGAEAEVLCEDPEDDGAACASL